MNKLEILEQTAADKGLDVIDYHFESDRLKGLYYNGTIALHNDIATQKEKACVLAEEIAHHRFTVGNILNQSNTQNRKQEMLARMATYNKMIGLIGLVNAFNAGCRNRFEIAEYLDVTEEFLSDALKSYRNKFGEYTTIDGYVIYFEPYLSIAKII